MKKNNLDNSLIIWGAVLISIILLGASGSAAPAKERVNKTMLNPTISKPVWVSAAATMPRTDSILLAVAMQNVRIASQDGKPLVVVPPRPEPRSPSLPPGVSTGNLPPWANAN